LGLAAGFDKNAVAIRTLSQLGFGFTEVGAVTPRPQPGNQKPRVFRLENEKAIINQYGFNNAGMEKVNNRLQQFGKRSVVGLNIGANKNSLNMGNDFVKVLTCCAENIHFATINISSPNTKKIRDFQKREQLQDLLALIVESNKALSTPLPLFIKISPDLEYNQLEEIVTTAERHKLAGIIATNTSTDYKILKIKNNFSLGGVSGEPLFAKSTKILAQLSIISEGQIPLIGVGGISSGNDAFEKICAGATAVQLYSALAFSGPKLLHSILRDLNALLQKYGFSHISEAIGIKKYKYV
jgi:dihydroorotate dehydrogenase